MFDKGALKTGGANGQIEKIRAATFLKLAAVEK
jgi:hypothetical protein